MHIIWRVSELWICEMKWNGIKTVLIIIIIIIIIPICECVCLFLNDMDAYIFLILFIPSSSLPKQKQQQQQHHAWFQYVEKSINMAKQQWDGYKQKIGKILIAQIDRILFRLMK